jgi:hypothetical protein
MAVFVEFISVIVRRDAIDERYTGGWGGFVEDVPNRTLCADSRLARVGFMNPADTKTYVDGLERKGLSYLRDGKAVDLVVVDQLRGPVVDCNWVEYGQIALNPARHVTACRMHGDDDPHVTFPEGRDPT